MTHVLFVCLHNAGRSQMARALFDEGAGPPHTSASAGSIADPDGRLHPAVITVMDELGVDLSQAKPRRLTDELAEHADVIVTMGCGDSCPYFAGKRYVDWDLPDPKGQPLEVVRETRDEIRRRVAELICQLDAQA
jgi:protein-tyrosine-phosphatase